MSTILRPLYPVRPLLRKNADQLGLFGGMEPVKATAKAKARQKLYGGTAAPVVPVVPKPRTAPKPMAVPGKKPKEGDTRTNRAGNKEVLRSGRWRLADNPQVVAKEPPAAIVPVVEDIQEQDLVDESLPDVPMADPEPMPEEVQGLEEGDMDNMPLKSENRSNELNQEVESDTERIQPNTRPDARLGGQYSAAGDDIGGVERDYDSSSNRIVEPKLVTARANITKSADPSIVSESVRDHLREHQLQGAALAIASMDQRGGFLLADGTGAGKTRQMLAIAQTYAEKGKKVLIIAPAEVIKPNWPKKKMAGSFANDSAAMGVDIALAADASGFTNGSIAVTTYSRLSSFKDAVDKDTVLIFDEAHSLKNSTSQRTKHGMDMMNKCGQVCLATATPADKPEHIPYLHKTGILNGNKLTQIYEWMGLKPREVDTGRKVIKVWELPRGAKEKTKVYLKMAGLFDQLTEDGAMVKRELSMQGDVDVSFETITLPDKAHAMLEDIAENFDHGEGGGLRKAQMLMHQRRQLEPYKINAAVSTVKQELAAGRQVILFVSRVNKSEVLEEDSMIPVGGVGMMRGSTFNPDGKPRVIAASEGTAKLLREALEAEGITSIAELHGNAGAKAESSMGQFQSGGAKVLIATVESGGTGVNLDDTVGDAPRTMVMITPPFNAVQNLQAAGRVWRMTTKSSPKIRYLFTDTDVDSWNRSIIASKMAAVGAAVRGETGVLDLPEDVTDDAIEAFMEARDKGESVDILEAAPRPPKPEKPAESSKIPPGFRVNKYGGYTAGGTYVEAGKGYIRNEKGRWVTYAKSQVDEKGNVTPEKQPEKAKAISVSDRVATAQGIAKKINGMGQGKTPYTAEEIEAITYALKLIESADNDRGEERNNAGWSGSTRSDGVRLSKKANNNEPLSAIELSTASKILQIHSRQVREAGIDLPPHKEPIVAGLELTPTVWQGGDRVRVYLNGPGRMSYGYFDVANSGEVTYGKKSEDIAIDSSIGLHTKGREILQEIAPTTPGLTKALHPGPYLTLLGVRYVLDSDRGVLCKAARKRVTSPGQMSLFGGNEPKQGDTKVENGVTYQLNQHSRWERTDKAKSELKPKSVVPVVKDTPAQPEPEPMLEDVQGNEADQAIDKITNAARSISEAQQNLKDRAMIYQVEAKEKLAMQRGLPLNAYYELSYQEWMDAQDQPEALPQPEPEPIPEEALEDEGIEDDAEVMPEVEAEEELSSANKIPATYEETQNSNLTWEDIPALYENGHIDQIAWILDQPSLSLPFYAASRMLSILGFKDAKKKQILNKRYREEFFKKYPNSPGPSDWYGGFDIYMLKDAIESEGSLSKQKSQKAAKTQKVLKEAKEAFKANRHTGVQAHLLDLERKRKSLMDKASDMYDDAERMNRIWADARESGEIQGGQRHWVDALSARGQGPVGTRQRAHTRRLEAQKVKQEIEKIAQDPSFYENRYMHLAATLTKALHPGPYLTLLGVRYVLDSDRGVLRKASMSWEDFRSEAEAMHKEANSDNDPCWKGYEAVGMKRKKGRMVPNCVPVSR